MKRQILIAVWVQSEDRATQKVKQEKFNIKIILTRELTIWTL